MTHPSPARHQVSLAALWFGLFAAPVVWSLQMLVLYPVVAHGCFPRDHPLSRPIFPTDPIVLLVSIAALAVAAAAGVIALRGWRSTREEHPSNEEHLLETGEGRSRFMALGGMLLSGLFFFGIVLNGLPFLLLGPCG
jgi:hypothetical protein